MYDTYLIHHGIKGQKWGVRRYQNSDGSYTSAGKSRRKKTGLSKQQIRNLKDAAQIAGGAAAIYGFYKLRNPKGNIIYDTKSRFYKDVNLVKEARNFANDVRKGRYSKKDLKWMTIDALLGTNYYKRYEAAKNRARAESGDFVDNPRVESHRYQREQREKRYRNTSISIEDAKKQKEKAAEAFRLNPTKENKEKLEDALAQYRASKNNNSEKKDSVIKPKKHKEILSRVKSKFHRIKEDGRKKIAKTKAEIKGEQGIVLANNSKNIFHGDFLIHHGIKGQKWGVRRYQNPDGSYTSVGKARRSKFDNARINDLEFRSSLNKADVRSNNRLSRIRYKNFGGDTYKGASIYSKLKSDHQMAKAKYLKDRNSKNLRKLRNIRKKRVKDIIGFKILPKFALINSNNMRGKYYRYRKQGSNKTLAYGKALINTYLTQNIDFIVKQKIGRTLFRL